MRWNRPITDSLASLRTVFSVEFYPPKTEEGGRQILETALALRDQLQPDFVSITYGAGGATRDRTFRYARMLKEDCGFEVMPHLTCVGSSKEELLEIIRHYQSEGFCNIMALRGDPPKGETDFTPHPDGCGFANELVALIRQNTSGFCLGVAGYPEKHPEAPDFDTDLRHLKAKVDAGASFITTQLFFDNALFFTFVSRCRAAGISVPIVPGIMPVMSLKQIKRFSELGGTILPRELEDQLEACEGDVACEQEVGIEWARMQIRELVQEGCPGIHLYILNRSEPVLELAARLKSDGVALGRQLVG